ncbi:ABC transporter ATP-binding protein [uncultured Psychromonas sp.]|uniref:ABC transporter ATP-binding protein n=1 Tax=uncultured Psychromonas sp. TaxID=173974 RepID=UPI0026337604|nr:ABC transporter ATP-binding protein [uncultured Psychromonas sp.]
MLNHTDFDLQCTDIVRQFDDFTAVDQVSFAIKKGSFFSILGPSGCGKTTLLRMLAGFDDPTSGDIFIKGKSMVGVAPNKRPVNMVFQHLALFPNMNVSENIAYGLHRQGINKVEIKHKVEQVLARVNLSGSGQKKISQLSGGQKQRIAIARCLVLNPDVLLLDEPLGALDLKLREHMKVELKKLQQEFETTFVYITHDQSEALVMSDQVAVMNHGQFQQVGDPQQLYFQPDNAFVAGFVGDSNKWSAKVMDILPDLLQVKTASGLVLQVQKPENKTFIIGSEVEVFIRPEAIHISPMLESKVESTQLHTNQLHTKVNNILFDGANSQLLVEEQTSSEEIKVKLPQTAEFMHLKKGDKLQISFPMQQVNVFPKIQDK